MISRRTILGSIASAITSASAAAFAQPKRQRPLIAYLTPTVLGQPYENAFRDGLHALGYVDGQTIDIVARGSHGDPRRLEVDAREMVQLEPDVILANVSQAVLEVRKATSTIPIVCPNLIEPEHMGLVSSLARPGGNVTGTLNRIEGMSRKQVEIAHELLPRASTIGFLSNAGRSASSATQRDDMESAAAALGLKFVVVEARGGDELSAAFEGLASQGAQVVIVAIGFVNESVHIANLGLRTGLPSVYGFREHVEAGGLLSYGVNLKENYRRAAAFVDKILKGTNPADLPVEFPTKLELVINLRTAKTLGVSISPLLLVGADDVIE
jgi:putative ABC transport system substrate-binding protein